MKITKQFRWNEQDKVVGIDFQHKTHFSCWGISSYREQLLQFRFGPLWINKMLNRSRDEPKFVIWFRHNRIA